MISAINDDPVDAPPATGLVLTVAVVVVATLANYVGWLGWDTTKELGPDGNLHGPHEPWQVVGVVLVLGVIAAAAGWRRHPWVAVAVTTTVMTVSISVQGATEPRNDGLWPIGAFMVAIGTFLGVGLVAFLADAFAGDRSSEQPSTGWHRRPWVWVVIGKRPSFRMRGFGRENPASARRQGHGRGCEDAKQPPHQRCAA